MSVRAAQQPEPLFDREDWWDADGAAFRSLHAVTAFRLALLERWLGADWRGARVVDLGCGGGLMSVPLTRRGAHVVGVDLSQRALACSRRHGGDAFLSVCGDACAAPLRDGCADVVLLADVIEHVDGPARVVAEAGRVTRPGGHVFVNTIARTHRARWLAVHIAEGLRLVPRGTHDWRRFVQPAELDAMAVAGGLRRRHRCGEAPRLWATLRRRRVELRETRSLAIGYAALYRREGP